MRKNLIKTKFPGIYYELDSTTNIKTFIARIKVTGLINTEQIVGYSKGPNRISASKAYEIRVELINKIKSGESIKKVENPKLVDFFEDYIKYKKGSITDNKLYGYTKMFYKHISTSLQNKKMKDLRKDDFQKVINKLKSEGYKPSTVEIVKDIFSPMFNYAIDIGLLEKNLIKGLQFPKYDKNRYFSLEPEKAKALYQEILNIPDNQYRAMFLFLLRGRRANEVLTLDWSNIDLVNKKYTINDSQSKIRKILTFVLDDELIEALECLNVKLDGLVFVSPVTGKKFYSFPKRQWKKIKENVGIEDMKLHDFRHLLGFTLVNNGVELEKISRALGHSKITTTQMYSNQKEEMAKVATDNFLNILRK